MPLADTMALLSRAKKRGQGVGSFSVANLEMIEGVVKAAEETRTPVILQVAQVRLDTVPLHLIGAGMLAAARTAKVDIAVHLDHGLTLPCIMEAMELGFSSVMYDGSHLPLEENIANTRRVVDCAHERGISVEAEIGRIGRTESGAQSPLVYADPIEAVRFIRETGVDALAVGIGNSHGVYTAAPVLRFDILRDIQKQATTPLVLHGGSGLTDADFMQAIALGMAKINIATAFFQAAFDAARANGAASIFDISANIIAATRLVASEYIRLFGMKGDSHEPHSL